MSSSSRRTLSLDSKFSTLLSDLRSTKEVLVCPSGGINSTQPTKFEGKLGIYFIVAYVVKFFKSYLPRIRFELGNINSLR